MGTVGEHSSDTEGDRSDRDRRQEHEDVLRPRAGTGSLAAQEGAKRPVPRERDEQTDPHECGRKKDAQWGLTRAERGDLQSRTGPVRRCGAPARGVPRQRIGLKPAIGSASCAAPAGGLYLHWTLMLETVAVTSPFALTVACTVWCIRRLLSGPPPMRRKLSTNVFSSPTLPLN